MCWLYPSSLLPVNELRHDHEQGDCNPNTTMDQVTARATLAYTIQKILARKEQGHDAEDNMPLSKHLQGRCFHRGHFSVFGQMSGCMVGYAMSIYLLFQALI